MTNSKQIEIQTYVTHHTTLNSQRITPHVDCPGNLSNRRIHFGTLYDMLISSIVPEYTENDTTIIIAYVSPIYSAI